MERLLKAMALVLFPILVQTIVTFAAGQVAMTNCSGSLCFNPPTVSTPAGSNVTWSNQTAIPHTVTSDSGAWTERLVGAGASTSITFDNPGTFAYHCRFHASMVGTIAVIPAAPPTSAPTATPTSSPAAAPTSAPAAAPTSAPRLAGTGGGPGPFVGAALLLLGVGLLVLPRLRRRRA